MLIFRDEYAPLKSVKQLRRGKRVSEIEKLYGRSGNTGAIAKSDYAGSSDSSPKSKESDKIPDLTQRFFESSFYRRFQVQRE